MKSSLAICLLLISLHSHAGINKWVDAEGKVHYSDKPPADIKSTTVKSAAALEGNNIKPASGVSAPKTLAEREAEWKKSQKAKDEAAQKEAKVQEAASIKQKNCDSARSNLTTLENSPALVTYNSKGKRTIVDDDTRKQRTEEARQAVNSYCN